jgi:hypothetical protein
MNKKDTCSFARRHPIVLHTACSRKRIKKTENKQKQPADEQETATIKWE